MLEIAHVRALALHSRLLSPFLLADLSVVQKLSQTKRPRAAIMM
jgi:hypothetical protein